MLFNSIRPIALIWLYKYAQMRLTMLINFFLLQHVSIDIVHHQACYTSS
jgi:hypothetical protein